jgi:segregation and condensation protein A
MSFEAKLEIFEGPLDILLLLVRRGEIDPREIPVAEVVEQFFRYLLQNPDDLLGEASEFLALLSLLLEVKSQYLLPHADESPVEVEYQQQERMVERLLTYEQYRRAALMLEERARRWRDCFPRMVQEPPPEKEVPSVPQAASIWDLFVAFQKVLQEAEAAKPASIIYDEVPIQVYMERIMEKIRAKGRIAFRQLFDAGMNRVVIVNMLLAILELVVLRKIAVEQPELFGEIWLVIREDTAAADASTVFSEGSLGLTPERDSLSEGSLPPAANPEANSAN